MAERSPEVYGTVSGMDASGRLLVALDGGAEGLVEWNEISRQEKLRQENLSRLIGRRMTFLRMGRAEEGRELLSARQYEEREYLRICDDFKSRKRNVYSGRLVSVTPDGKLAFYRIAQGVSGALHVSSFSLCRVYSFRDIDLPKQLSVVIAEVDERGWLSLSAKPSFGDFEYTLERLGLQEGVQTEGFVTNILPAGAAAVMLAPNLSVLLDACCRVHPGDRVRLRIKRIDREINRIKAVMLERLETAGERFNYEAWCRPVSELGDYVDGRAFDERIRLKRVQSAESKSEEPKSSEMEFSVNAQRSPFSTYINERIVREVRRPSRVQDINFEARMGYLGERHMKVAEAVEALKYSSAWQIRRYLFLRTGTALSERELKGIIDRLVKLDIVGVLRFQSDEGSLLTRVLHPSLNYRAFCGRNPRNFGAKDFMETDASGVKTRLAANQLLIGLLRCRKDVEEIDTHPFLHGDDSDVRLRPRHMLRCSGKKCYLEAVRKGWEQEMYDKLLRYDKLLDQEEEAAEVAVVLESAGMVQEMAARIGEMRLGFSVHLTDDLSCLPEPKLTEVAAPPRSLLQRIRLKLEEIQI